MPSLRAQCEGLFAEAVKHCGMEVLGWRDVPGDNTCLGEIALAAEPIVRQAFIDGCGMTGEILERRLFMARKRAERLIREKLGERAVEFYISSMSCRTLVYKGMFLAHQLFEYYKNDINDPRLVSPLCLVHQRYSTNTFPNWRLAQPFRMIAHNGEINTLSGNRNRMRARERRLASPLLGEDLSDLTPVLTEGASDSAQFDNCLELLVRAGRSLPHALMMMVPEAFGAKYHMSADKRAFYEYHAAIMEPWDGPAAIVVTDGRFVGGTLDRNGLRPARYTITTDGQVVLASETGVVEFPPEKVQQKGRLQPGRMFLVDIQDGRFITDNELKSKIARRKPYRRWTTDNRIELGGLFTSTHLEKRDPVTLAQRMRLFGFTREELKMVLAPMALNAQEPVGSMGTDTPLAVLSRRPRLLYDYFKQRFAQVTNPPIDPLREGLVMSLMTYAGKRRNILAETPEHGRQLKLPHPILTDEDMDRLHSVRREDFRAATIPAFFEFDETDSGASLKRGLEAMLAEAQKALAAARGALNYLRPQLPAGQGAAYPACWPARRCTTACSSANQRGEAGIIVETGEAREVMHFCLLMGYGANAINPYLALEVLEELAARAKFPSGWR